MADFINFQYLYLKNGSNLKIYIISNYTIMCWYDTQNMLKKFTKAIFKNSSVSVGKLKNSMLTKKIIFFSKSLTLDIAWCKLIDFKNERTTKLS